MRLSVRDGLKMKKQGRSTTSLQLHSPALFSSTTHYFSGNSSDTQLSEISIMQQLPTTLRLPLKEIEKKLISYSSKERQVFASLIKSNSAVSVLAQHHSLTRSTTPLLLLYRKENSALDRYCLHNVYLSRLYISRQNATALTPLRPSPCTGILTCFLFDQWKQLWLDSSLLTLSDWS